jgi:predicted dehydrogenase
MSRAALRVAVIGCGYWGANYVRALNDLPTVQLVAACDEVSEQLSQVRYRYPSVDVTTNVEDVLGRTDIDAMVLCVQAEKHYDLGLRAVEAGKHILVEKPLATTVGDAEHLIDAARGNGLTLMVGHTFLYNPAIAKVMEYVAGRSNSHGRKRGVGPRTA